MISALHQAHLGSLAEDSEEGSDVISESDGGLIHDDDLPIESSPAVSASLDQSPAQMAAGSSTNSTSAAQDHRAAAGSDGMFELDINDDFEQAIGVSSFTAKGNQERYPDAQAADMQKISAAPAAATQNSNAILGMEPVSASLLIERPQSTSSQAQHAQQAQYEQPQHTQQPVTESGQQPTPDSVHEAALSSLPILGPLPEAASLSAVATASQPRAASVGDMTQVDLEEIELGEATKVGATPASAGQVVADEWEEVNLARAKELAVDAPSAAMPGDKVGLLFSGLVATCISAYTHAGQDRCRLQSTAGMAHQQCLYFALISLACVSALLCVCASYANLLTCAVARALADYHHHTHDHQSQGRH